MSFRKIPTNIEGIIPLLREMLDRIENFESGRIFAGGKVSFNAIQVGDVEITVSDGTGSQRVLHFRNVLTGVEQTFTL